jgi:hypothetical protein
LQVIGQNHYYPSVAAFSPSGLPFSYKLRWTLKWPNTPYFVESYTGLVGFGLDRKTDESTVICHLQKFSDDALMAAVITRMTDAELAETFDLITRLLRRHLKESEYHRLFLKDT